MNHQLEKLALLAFLQAKVRQLGSITVTTSTLWRIQHLQRWPENRVVELEDSFKPWFPKVRRIYLTGRHGEPAFGGLQLSSGIKQAKKTHGDLLLLVPTAHEDVTDDCKAVPAVRAYRWGADELISYNLMLVQSSASPWAK
jgi:hypothetical protein